MPLVDHQFNGQNNATFAANAPDASRHFDALRISLSGAAPENLRGRWGAYAYP